MKGLEAVEISLSECREVIDFRIDANTYKKDYLKSDLLIKGKNPTSILNLSTSVQNFGAYSLCTYINFVDKGIPFVMTENVRHNYIDWNIRKCVDQQSHEMLYKSHCKKGQVLVTMAGEYLGRVAVYDREAVCSSNQAIAKITLKDKMNPYMVSTFLNSKHGQNQINRFKTITGQPNINMSLIKALNIPEFSEEMSSMIESVVVDSERNRKKSREKYIEAEEYLVNQVGLKNYQPSKNAVNVKMLGESFGVSGRLDAEYYQPKFEEIIHHIESQPHDKLISLVSIKKSIEPGSIHYVDVGFPFLRVADFDKFGLSMPNKYLSKSFISENIDLINSLKPKKGTILFTKDGSVGTAYHLKDDIECVTSGAVLHLSIINPDELIPEYLTLALNSLLVQMQAERDAGGSIILHWRVNEIENVVVPIISKEKQLKIASLVEESFKLKNQSENLLEVAKIGVELSIEKNEAIAMKFITEKVV